jgi:hypothetical protein
MKSIVTAVVLALLCSGCNKMADVISPSNSGAGQFVDYTIRKGNQYCEGNAYQPIETGELKFTVRFDSTAIYQTVDPVNQFDINKLYGFSDNNALHHQFSARFGWRWSEGALRLFAYVYNEGAVLSKELTTVQIGQELACSISVTGTHYIFTAGKVSADLPRMSTTPRATGYRLYPYFGGDETAPHEIHIWIRKEGGT